MALNFPNAPSDGAVFTDTATGEKWVYEQATNSWTSQGVTIAGGLKYKGSIDITAAPPTGRTPDSLYTVGTGGTASTGFGPGVTGTVLAGAQVLYDGAAWHVASTAPPAVWNSASGKLTPKTTGDKVDAAHLAFTQAGTGAVQRTVESKLKDVVSVKDFGAVGDGVADDTSKFIAAAASGKHVLIPEGSYKLTQYVPGTFYAIGQVTYVGGGFTDAQLTSRQFTQSDSNDISWQRQVKARSQFQWDIHANSSLTVGRKEAFENNTIAINSVSYDGGTQTVTATTAAPHGIIPGKNIYIQASTGYRQQINAGAGTTGSTLTWSSATDPTAGNPALTGTMTAVPYTPLDPNGGIICGQTHEQVYTGGQPRRFFQYWDGPDLTVTGESSINRFMISRYYSAGVGNAILLSSGSLPIAIGHEGGAGFPAQGYYAIHTATGTIFADSYTGSGATDTVEIRAGNLNLSNAGALIKFGSANDFLTKNAWRSNVALGGKLAELSSTNAGATARTALFFATDVEGYSGADCGIRVAKNNATGRSLNAGGTLNASGADYAEYMEKSGDFVIAKGDVCGVDSNGLLTQNYAEAISFVVKSTNPSYVGGDTWGCESEIGKSPDSSDPDAVAQWEAALEAARQKVDRVAFAGQVPVNVTGATPGQYIIPVNDDGLIKGIPVSHPTFEQYQSAVGKVIAIEPDGRARIIVKVS